MPAAGYAKIGNSVTTKGDWPVGNETGTLAIWDVENALCRMGDSHYRRYRDTYRRVAVMGNATAGLPIKTLYSEPARGVLSGIRANVERPGMVSEKLLSGGEQQACIQALQALDSALAEQPSDLSLYALCTQPADGFPKLIPLFRALDAASPFVCVPFVQPGYDPAVAKPHLDALLALLGGDYTYIDLYDRAPKPDMKQSFNRIMVGAKRAGLLVELRGIRKPSAACYISDPADGRWDVRSCVPPENAVLFKEVHLKINTMAYLMAGLTYGDFFGLPIIDPKVLPHFKSRVAAEPGYWFTALEKERIGAALDAIVAFLGSSDEHRGLTLRTVYSTPDVPAEVLVQFQRILDVKPEICLPFMNHTWDHAEAADAIDVFLKRNRDRSLKQLYTDPPQPVKANYTQSEFELLLKQQEATKTLLAKSNNLICYSPGQCVYRDGDYCSTGILGNCTPE